MSNSRATLLILMCVTGLTVLIALRKPGHMPTTAKEQGTKIESSADAQSTPASNVHAAKKRFIARREFIAQQSLDFEELVRAKLSAWHNELDERAQYRLLQELCALLTDKNAAGIVQSLSPNDLAGRFGLAALERWLATDPNGAAAWIASRADITDEQASLAARMLWNDREALQTFLDRLPDGELKKKLLYSAAFEMAAIDPRQAIAIAGKMNADDAKGVLQAAAFQWARSDPDAAKTWAEQNTDAGLRDGLISAAVKGMAEEHPREAANWLVSSVKNPDLMEEAAESVIRSWAAKEPSATADWVAQFPDGATRNEALETVMNFWSASDPVGARAWATNLPDNTMRQQAVAILAR